jgi:hypothetical protein
MLFACDGGDETIPAEVYIVSFLPIEKKYETSTDMWAMNVLTCAGWQGQAAHDTRVVTDFTSTENNYKLEMRSDSTTSLLWDIRIRVLDHISDFDESEKQAAVVAKMCYYLKDDPDNDTDGKWERIALEQSQ